MFDKIQRIRDDRTCDNALIAIAEGNLEALSIIYKLYGRMIMSISLQITKNSYDAEDVLQDVMLKISRCANQYQKHTNPRAWVLALARNTAIDYQKAKSKEIAYDDIADELHNSCTSDAEPSFQTLLMDALSTLSEIDQSIVRMKLYVGLSHAEIASVLNLTKSATEKRYERALKKVQEYFNKE